MRTLNLASQPFESERLPALLTGLGLVLALVASFWHVNRVCELSSTKVDRGDLVARERQLRELYSSAHRVQPERPSPRALQRWATLKELVDRRSFSWGALLSDLEGLLPRDVRLVSINPELEDGATALELRAVARTRPDGYEFVRVLQASERFSRVIPLSVAATASGEDFVYHMRYDPKEPQREGQAP